MEPIAVARALVAATSDASERGLPVEEATVVQNSNRLAVRLLPCDVLARVAPLVARNQEFAAFEVEMARRLEEAGSPIAVLDPRMAPRVHLRDGFAITYWTYYEPLPAAGITAAQYAQALAGLHAGMRQIDVAAPHFTARVEEARSIVRDRSRSPELNGADRELLATVLHSLSRRVAGRGADEQLLHGEPHPGNLLRTTAGPRFIDLETCCYGPPEFDIAHTPAEVREHYPSADTVLLCDCRILTLAMVAAWRADRDDAFPNGHAMRDELLGLVRNAAERHDVDVRH